MIVLALSSGTSADAIDVAVVEFTQDGEALDMQVLSSAERPWPDGLAERIRAIYPPAVTMIDEVTALTTLIGQAFAAAAVEAVGDGVGPDLIVSHGQTVFHWVEHGVARGTLQLGEPAWIAEATGVPVLSNLRSRDIAAGGQGAPLAGTLDDLWLAGIADVTGSTSVAALNLGGIANISVWTPEGLASYDTGPANCLIDDAVVAATDGARTFDRGGRIAAAGEVRSDLLDQLLADGYYDRVPPKSTGREHFHAGYAHAMAEGLLPVSTEDLVATLTELTARTVTDRLDGVDLVVASGGGIHNPTLMGALAAHLGSTRLTTSEEFGIDPGVKEACLFALLGYLAATGNPGTVAGPDGHTTTGASGPRILGDFTPGAGPLTLPPAATPVRRLIPRRAARPIPRRANKTGEPSTGPSTF